MSCDEELQKNLECWNPMQEDYNNAELNQYTTGPGAALDLDLQSSKNANFNKPTLIFINAKRIMSLQALQNFCSSHAKVSSAHEAKKNNHYFIRFENVAAMEACFRALKDNEFGLQVEIARQRKKQLNNQPIPYNNKIEQPPLMSESKISMEERTYRTWNKLEKPKLKSLTQPTLKSDYDANDSLLQYYDPHRHYLIEEDAHELERLGLQNKNIDDNNKRTFYTGRMYKGLPEYLLNFFEDAHKKSGGLYDEINGVFLHEPHGAKNPNIQLGTCSECQSICDYVCSQCNAVFFCSEKCQQLGWPEHRLMCDKTSTAQHIIQETVRSSIQKQIASFSSNSEKPEKGISEKNTIAEYCTPKSGEVITIVSIIKTNLIFVRSKKDETIENFINILTRLENEKNFLQPLKEPVKVGQIVITKFKYEFQRAMILDAKLLEKIRIIYIDYGNIEYKNAHELYAAPKWVTAQPRLITSVQLKNVGDYFMTENIREFMYSYLEEIDMSIKYEEEDMVKGKNIYEVELFDSKGQNFNSMLITLIKPTISRSVFYMQDIVQLKLPVGDNIKLLVMDNFTLTDGSVSCTIEAYYAEIIKFQKIIQEYGGIDEQNYAPRPNELCIAKSEVDGLWYRGCCMELVGDGYPTIFFIDYGDCKPIHVSNIRPYPEQFKFPVYTAECEIAGFPESVDAQLVEKLQSLIPVGAVIHCDTISAIDNGYLINSPDIIKALKNAGFLND